MHLVVCAIIIAILITVLYGIHYKETFLGAMTQMYAQNPVHGLDFVPGHNFSGKNYAYAKGPQDDYLTVGTDRYVPPYFYGNNWLWNMPTRSYYPFGYYYPYWFW